MNAKKENQGLWLLLTEIILMIASLKGHKSLFKMTYFIEETRQKNSLCSTGAKTC
jgi:hypothetical protein